MSVESSITMIAPGTRHASQPPSANQNHTANQAYPPPARCPCRPAPFLQLELLARLENLRRGTARDHRLQFAPVPQSTGKFIDKLSNRRLAHFNLKIPRLLHVPADAHDARARCCSACPASQIPPRPSPRYASPRTTSRRCSQWSGTGKAPGWPGNRAA